MPNRLIKETSPYLLQHAHNPVDWYPWGDEALTRARTENKVILVSIGYSACHWCHVMERESFEVESTAELMNEFFINIKIDREERPDLDHIYMDAVQLLSGSGGWPLNVFLTPTGKPFYGGTYFPPVRAYNRSSWTDVISAIQQAWLEKPAELVEQAESLTSHMQKTSLFSAQDSGNPGAAAEQVNSIVSNLMKTADTAWGGFGNAPKFPQTFSISFLLRQSWFDGGQLVGKEYKDVMIHSPLLKQALLSLDKMIMGGIYDQLGGGFARYSTDAQWLAPHFEKMLYDNALLISVISDAYLLTQKPHFFEVIRQTMDFISKEWQDEDGGFFSAYDADSEGEEGKFYTWEKKEIEELIEDPESLEIFTSYYGVTQDGNWEHTNILWVQQPLEIFCLARGLDYDRAARLLEQGRNKLLDQRSQREKPLLDDKKLLGWNALMITASCKAWCATGIYDYLQMGIRAAAFIESCLKSADGNYYHNYKNGKAANNAFLDDLAAYVEALCFLQECTGDIQYLKTAERLTTVVLENFGEENGPFFYFTPAYQQDIVFRKKDMYDGATPSGNSLMAGNLLYLGTLLDKQQWKEQALLMVRQMENLTCSYPGSFGNWAQRMQEVVHGVKEIAVVGNRHLDVSEKLLNLFIPNKIFQQSATGIEEFPLLRSKNVKNRETEIYLCFQFSCKAPVNNVENFLQLVNNQ